MKVLVSGATGFVGTALTERLVTDNLHAVRVAVRRPSDTPEGVETCAVGNVSESTDWAKAVDGVDCVIHALARVHVMRDSVADPLAAYKAVNTDATLHLAKQASIAGVRRLIFLSSIKVNGDLTSADEKFHAQSKVNPSGPYAISKWEAEKGLRKISAETGLETVIIRPPLVYGPGVKANFKRMMWWVYKGLPLPLGAVRNQRSLIALPNLVDLLANCVDHSAAKNEAFLASDDHDLSTPELLCKLGEAADRKVRLIPVPPKALALGASLCRATHIFNRLCASMEVDIEHTKRVLEWRPPVGVDQALTTTMRHFLMSQKQ